MSQFSASSRLHLVREFGRLCCLIALVAISGELWASGFPPIARDDEVIVSPGGTVSVLRNGSTSVLDNDIDFEGDKLSAILRSNVRHGELTLNPDGTFLYRHDGKSVKNDEFKYRAFDGTRQSRDARVRIEIFSTDPIPPEIVGQNDVRVNEDESLNLQLEDLRVVDPDSKFPDDFTIEINDGDNYTRDGSVIKPLPDFNGQLTVLIRVFDSFSFSNFYPLTVDVLAENDVPIVLGEPPDQEAIEQIPFELSLAEFFSDVDEQDTIEFSARGLPASESLRIDSLSGAIVGTPIRIDASNTPYSVVVTATDSAGASASLGFSLIVLAEDRADLSVFATVVMNPVMVGESANWLIDITNKGPADFDTGNLVLNWATSGPTLTITAPEPCVVLNNATRNPSATCTIGQILAGTSLTVELRATQDSDGDNTIIAVAIADDPNLENNSALAASQVIAEFSEGPTQILDSVGSDIAGGDLDGDGLIDFVVVSDETRLFFNNGSRGLTTPGLVLEAGSAATSVALLDWNGDGALDIAISGISRSSATIYVNDGRGSYPDVVQLENSGVGDIHKIAAADFDIDGKSELVLTGSIATAIVTSSGGIDFELERLPIGAGIDITVADLNQDAFPDMLVVESGDRAIAVMLNSGDGSSFNISRLHHGSVGHLSATDMNGDGAADLLIAMDGDDLEAPENRILYQQGDGGFTTGWTFGASVISNILTGDVDGDGRKDIIAVNDAGVHQVYLGDVNGNYALQAEQIVSSGMTKGVLVDFNADGSSDLIMAGVDAIEIHANNGIGRMGLGDRLAPDIALLGEAAITIVAGDPFSDPGATATDDIDGDLSDKIVTTGSVNSTIVGTYTINYRVSDRAGNSSSIQRQVTVIINDGVGGGGGGALGLQTICLLILFVLWGFGRCTGTGYVEYQYRKNSKSGSRLRTMGQ